MKDDYTKYFLYTEQQREAFIASNDAMIQKNRKAFANWINNLPLGVRLSYLDRIKENERPFVIGLICLLYCEGVVNVSFHEEGWSISRDPRTSKEYSQWMQEYGFKTGKNKKLNND